jgi:hypothetical protein
MRDRATQLARCIQSNYGGVCLGSNFMIFGPKNNPKHLQNYSECRSLTVWRDHSQPNDHFTSNSAFIF